MMLRWIKRICDWHEAWKEDCYWSDVRRKMIESGCFRVNPGPDDEDELVYRLMRLS